MKALILAGGFAVRLYPLTENFPKPLLKIKDKPIIEYLLEKISKIKEIDEIYIVTNKILLCKPFFCSNMCGE